MSLGKLSMRTLGAQRFQGFLVEATAEHSTGQGLGKGAWQPGGSIAAADTLVPRGVSTQGGMVGQLGSQSHPMVWRVAPAPIHQLTQGRLVSRRLPVATMQPCTTSHMVWTHSPAPVLLQMRDSWQTKGLGAGRARVKQSCFLLPMVAPRATDMRFCERECGLPLWSDGWWCVSARVAGPSQQRPSNRAGGGLATDLGHVEKYATVGHQALDSFEAKLRSFRHSHS